MEMVLGGDETGVHSSDHNEQSVELAQRLWVVSGVVPPRCYDAMVQIHTRQIWRQI